MCSQYVWHTDFSKQTIRKSYVSALPMHCFQAIHSQVKIDENSTGRFSTVSTVSTRLGMDDSTGLLLDRPDDLRVAVTHVGHADPGREVQQPRTFARRHIASLAVNFCSLSLVVVESRTTCMCSCNSS